MRRQIILGLAGSAILTASPVSLPFGEWPVEPSITSIELSQTRGWNAGTYLNPSGTLVCYVTEIDQPEDCAPAAEPTELSWVNDLGDTVNVGYVPPTSPREPTAPTPEPREVALVITVGLLLVELWRKIG